MQHFTRKQIYKAAEPCDTIQRIRRIFYDCDIFLTENVYTHADSATTAVMLRFGDDCFRSLPIGTSGKGMNSRYALASAYGEMIERLQCQILLRPWRQKAFSQGDLDFLYAPDEQALTFREVLEECGELLRIFLNIPEERFQELFSALGSCKTLCLPFRDICSGQTVMFPYDLLSGKINSNGMCSGNTPEEALSQGICELYERQALMLLYRDNPAVPSLPRELFEGSEVLHRLEALERLGFSFEILDCSMGLSYPVIGLRLSLEGGKLIGLGADPDPVVALERCLTEQYQILSPERFKNRFAKESCGIRDQLIYDFEKEYYHHQLVRSKCHGSGKKPDNLFYPSGLISDHFSCKEDAAQSDFTYLKELTLKNNCHLFVRDWSWLGFPSFLCFSPELSLADYQYDETAVSLAGILKNGRHIPDPDGYENVLPLLKRLDLMMRCPTSGNF